MRPVRLLASSFAGAQFGSIGDPLIVNERIEIYTQLTPNECAERISASIVKERSPLFSFSSFSSQPVAGRVDGISVRLRKRISYRNSFQPLLTATLQPHGTGTVVRGEFAIHAFTRVFMMFWFGGVVLIGGTAFIGSVISLITRPAQQDNGVWPFVLIVPGMLIFGILLNRLCRYLARDETKFLTDFLRRTLDDSDKEQPPNQALE